MALVCFLVLLGFTWFGKVLFTWFLTFLIFASQPAAKAGSEKTALEGCRPRLETERGNHGELQQWRWLKQTLVYVPLYSTPPPVHTLPMRNHLMHVLLLSLVNHKWGMGSSLLQSTPPLKTHTHTDLTVHGRKVMQKGS